MSAVISQGFEKQVKRNYWLSNLYYVLSDVYRQWRLSRQIIDTGSGTTHASLSLDASVSYIQSVFDDYRKYGGVDSFRGRIAEVGPGDNCGVAMLLLENGGDNVDLPDRFYSRRDPVQQSQIYKALWERYPALRDILGEPDPTREESFRGVRRYHGSEASCEQFFAAHRGYNYILSRSVLEHVTDPRQALRLMCDALRPEGKLIHKVDLRDHGMYSDHFHELKFLEAPGWLHSRMTRASGRPNRCLINIYRDTLESCGMKHEFLVTWLAGVGEIVPHVPYEDIPLTQRNRAMTYVDSIRPNLARSFDDLSDEDISVAGFFLVAQKEVEN